MHMFSAQLTYRIYIPNEAMRLFYLLVIYGYKQP